jgi:pimeloyl-ACP methyl ester carboxylesterase
MKSLTRSLAGDTIDFMDALKIQKAILAGFDLGARTANIIAALWPEHCKAMVSVSGYLIGSQESGNMPLPPKAGQAMTNTGTILRSLFGSSLRRSGTSMMRRSSAAQHRLTIPITFSIVVHNYRWRLGLAEGEPKYDDLEKRLAEFPLIRVPTIALEGDANGAPHSQPSAYAGKFPSKYSHRLIKGGVGHHLPQKAPQAFAQAVVDVDNL